MLTRGTIAAALPLAFMLGTVVGPSTSSADGGGSPGDSCSVDAQGQPIPDTDPAVAACLRAELTGVAVAYDELHSTVDLMQAHAARQAAIQSHLVRLVRARGRHVVRLELRIDGLRAQVWHLRAELRNAR